MNIYTKVLIQNICLMLLILVCVYLTKSAWCLWGLLLLFKTDSKESKDGVTENSLIS